MAAEDNEQMVSSYLMIDPLGRFFQNNAGYGGYSYSQVIDEHTIEQALDEIGFEYQRFLARYPHVALVAG